MTEMKPRRKHAGAKEFLATAIVCFKWLYAISNKKMAAFFLILNTYSSVFQGSSVLPECMQNERSFRHMASSYCPVDCSAFVVEAELDESDAMISELKSHGAVIENPATDESLWVAELEKFFEALVNIAGIKSHFCTDPFHIPGKRGILRDFYDGALFKAHPVHSSTERKKEIADEDCYIDLWTLCSNDA